MFGRDLSPALSDRHDRLIPAPTTAGDGRILGRLHPQNIRWNAPKAGQLGGSSDRVSESRS